MVGLGVDTEEKRSLGLLRSQRLGRSPPAVVLTAIALTTIQMLTINHNIYHIPLVAPRARLRGTNREFSQKELQAVQDADFDSWKKRLFAEKAVEERRKILKNDTAAHKRRQSADQKRIELKNRHGVGLAKKRSRDSAHPDTIAQRRLKDTIENECMRLGDIYWVKRQAREARKRNKRSQKRLEGAT